jgi:pimeloyl-ACP methyl ester carboxylesterase
MANEWDVDLGAIRRPVAVWHGAEDKLAPVSHGRWLAEHVARARVHIIDGEGHLSIGVRYLDRIVDELVAMAARRPRRPDQSRKRRHGG